MNKPSSPRNCSECGKRRVPAKRSNGRLSTKCKECFGGLFWSSHFGRWFANAATRQSQDSMPYDEDDITGIYHLWVTRRKAIGYTVKDGKVIPTHDYHISHRDPARGNGFQGRLTTGNLMVAPAKANKNAYNSEPVDHGYRVITNRPPFGDAAKVRQWCGGQYDLNGLVRNLELKKYSPSAKSSGDIDPEFLPNGVHPSVMLENQLSRFEGGSTSPWIHTSCSPSHAFTTAIVYGIGLGDGKLKAAVQTPPEEPEEPF